MTIEIIHEGGGTQVISPGKQEVIGLMDGFENTIYRVAEVIDPDTVGLFSTGMVYNRPDKVMKICREQINNHPELSGRMRWVQD